METSVPSESHARFGSTLSGTGHRARVRRDYPVERLAGGSQRKGTKPFRDSLCCRRIDVRQHCNDVAGLPIDPQVPFMPGAPPPWPTEPFPSASRRIFEPIRVPAAEAHLLFSGDQQLRGVPAEQLVAQQRLGEPCEVLDRRVTTTGGGSAIRQRVSVRDPLRRSRWLHVADRPVREPLGLRAAIQSRSSRLACRCGLARSRSSSALSPSRSRRRAE